MTKEQKDLLRKIARDAYAPETQAARAEAAEAKLAALREWAAKVKELGLMTYEAAALDVLAIIDGEVGR